MSEKYQTFDIIEEITRVDGTTYYELANIFMNGRAELAAQQGFIKEVRIIQLNIAHSTAVQVYEEYINTHYEMPEVDATNWEEWEKPAGEIAAAFSQVLKANHVG